MILRKLQAVGVELLLGLACVMAGTACMIPNKGLLYTLTQQSGFGPGLSLLMVATGIGIIWAAIRTKRRLRICSAVASNMIWASIGFAYVYNQQYGLVMFLSVLFFAFTCLISLDGWE